MVSGARPLAHRRMRPLRRIVRSGARTGARTARLLWDRVPGEQRDESLSVGGAPAGDRIPAGSRRVADDRLGRELHGVASLGDVVEGLVVAGAAGDLVDGRIDEAQAAPCVLIR